MSFALSPAFLAHASAYALSAVPYVAFCAFIFSLLALLLLIIIERRIRRLALGRSGTLAESLAVLTREMKEAQEFRVEIEKYLKLVEARLRGALQGVGVVRFNPFSSEGQGGNQSFAAAFLDEGGGGVVFSTLYARDRVSVYAKPVAGGISTFELTDEEKSAIEKAKKAIAEHKKKPVAEQKI